MKRSVAREFLFKFIYEIEIQKDAREEHINLCIENYGIKDEKLINYIKTTIKGIKENENEIINIIKNNLSEKWEINRVSKVNIAILKLAIYEIMVTKLPYKLVINEAVEIAKKYGEETSYSFINGILASFIVQQNLS